MSDSAPASLDALSYEQARDELVQVVNRLEQGGATLEESLQLWERGEALAARCEDWLLGARRRLEAARSGAGATEKQSSTDEQIGNDSATGTISGADGISE